MPVVNSFQNAFRVYNRTIVSLLSSSSRHGFMCPSIARGCRPASSNAGNSGETQLEQIYVGSLASRIKVVKVFSLSTSLSGLAAQPILIEHGSRLGGMPMVVLLCSVVGVFTFVTPLLLHWITKKYVTEIMYNRASKEYTATTISFFLTKDKKTFKVQDITVPEIMGMFATFVVKGKPLFVDPAMFSDPNHYVKMMGYDKPIDFKLNPPADSSQAKTKSN